MDRAFELYSRIKATGEEAIDDLIETRASEELFLDFKRSADNGANRRLHQNDRNNLAKAISGFGNSSGGVIVWGVDCSADIDGADVARAKVPITNPERFVANLQGAVSGCTMPVHDGVEHYFVLAEDGSVGFALSYIPASQNSPHQVVQSNRYYIRAGSDFLPAPHQVLAGMFGRRPQPKVFHMIALKPATHTGNKRLVVECGITITNEGPGIARDVFFTSLTTQKLGDKANISWEIADKENWTSSFAYGVQFSLISNESLRLPPKSFRTPIYLRLEIEPPLSEDLKIKCNVGCAGAPIVNFEFQNDRGKVYEIYRKYFANLGEPEFDEQFRYEIAKRLLNPPVDS